MILKALYEYYQRKAANPESLIAPQGLEWKMIPYLIVIDKNGNFFTNRRYVGGIWERKTYPTIFGHQK